MTSPSSDIPDDVSPRAKACLTLLSVAALYQAVMAYTEGLFNYLALVISIGIVTVSGWTLVKWAVAPGRPRRVSRAWLAMLIAGQVCIVPFAKHLYYYSPPAHWQNALPVVGLALMVLISTLLVLMRRPPRWGALVVCALGVLTGFLVVRHSLAPRIDVWMFHQESAEALLNGVNPYSITFINPYGQGNPFYSQQVQQDGRILFGFPYPPMSMWAYLPSYWLTGESRYAHGLAFMLAGLGMTLLSRSRLSLGAGLLLMTAPAQWVVIECAWTEPFLLLALVALALTATRAPAWTPVALAVFLAMKQYTVVFLPLVFLLLPRPLGWRSSLRFCAITLVVGAALSLPLALWDWDAFWHSCVSIQLKQPFRFDAFSYLALYANLPPAITEPPAWWSAVPFAMLLPTWAILLWRMPRNITGFALGVTGVMIVFLFFNRQSFLNYHTFCIGAMLTAVALLSRDDQAAVVR